MMTVCGYNARMGEGIRVLFQGMYEAIEAKARDEGRSLGQILERELIEIPQINKALKDRGVGASLRMFQGLNEMAFAHFKVAADMQAEVTRETFMNAAEVFIRVLEEVEEKNLSEAFPSQDRNAVAERAARLGRWITDHYSDPLERWSASSGRESGKKPATS